jgi:carboxymethylenebutenolidase
MADKTAAVGAQGNPAVQGSEFVVCPQARQAFHADYRPSYRKEAAEDCFKRALAWFKAHGVV